MSHSKSLITPLTPNFQGEFARRFDSLCKDLDNVQARDLQDARFQEEIQWVEARKTNQIEAHRYKTAIMVLSDLLSLSWEIDYSSVGLQLYSPSPVQSNGMKPEQIREAKKAIRSDLMESVNKQLLHPATQDFIRRMETPHSTAVQEYPISALIADGRELLDRLTNAETFQDSIKPYLQLVNYEQRDEYTGIKLGEIWRYFRLTWSIPYTGVPGRQLFYLVRDAAHPHHAVIGIAALSNSAMQLRDRDNHIGWTLDTFLDRMKQSLAARNHIELNRLFDLLEMYIERSLDDIEQEGLVSPTDVKNPTEQVVNSLRTQVEYFSRAREDALREIQSADADEAIIDEQGETLADLESDITYLVDDEILRMDTRARERLTPARRWLVLKKRAQELSRLLSARRTFQLIRNSNSLIETLDEAINKEHFKGAVYSALIANKNLQIGINMLEITTCGAVEPYNHILGGKLVALLMMSPQIIADYKARYEGQPSLIASQLANKRVYRPCDLVFLGTTSLYSVGSSQYNRLRLPAGTFHPDQPELRYVSVGKTSGFGTVQFSSETSRALSELENYFLGFRNVNSVFGEGFSPKLRKVRAGLNNLGFDSSVMLKHNQPRLIYAIDLCNVSRQFLRGETEELPDYIRNPTNTKEATAKIAEYWIQRWLSNRIRRKDVQNRLEQSQGISLRQEIDYQKVPQVNVDIPPDESMTDQYEFIPEPKNSVSVEFLQRLYRDTSAYSDQLDDTQRTAINIETALETFILDNIQSGISVVLTGNAGDGKTHVLKRLNADIEATGAKVILDASVVKPDEIISTWKNAIEEDVPFCIAANEWPLFTLIRDFGDDFSPLRAVRDQIAQQLVYDENMDTIPDPERDGVVVVDLGKRNHLQQEFFLAALKAILRNDLYEQCSRCHFLNECDTTKNRRFLSHERVVHRLSQLVLRLAVMGYHVTVRELLSALSYMVFGGRVCKTLAQQSGTRSGFYSDQLFSSEAVGKLFDLFREHIDPAAISHPHWDVRLYYNDYRDSEWIDSDTIEPSRSDSNVSLETQKPIFEHLKRRFYFEHERGHEILNMTSDDEQRFASLIDPSNSDTETILDDILTAINAYFCPVIPESEAREKLFVWSSHHYDERAPRAFLSKQQIERSKGELVIQKPRLSSTIHNAFEYYPDHVRLVAYPHDHDRRRWLDIDFSLFKVLMDVERGLPTMLVPEEKSVRLHQFMNALQAVDPNQNVDRQIVWSYTVTTKERASFTVRRTSRQIDL